MTPTPSEQRPAPFAGSMAMFVFLSILAATLVPLFALYVMVFEAALSSARELTRDRAAIVARAIEGHVVRYLDTVPQQAAGLAAMFRERDAPLSDRDEIAMLFRAALSATPQVATLSFASFDGRVLRVFRDRPENRVRTDDWSDDPTFMTTLKAYETATAARWDGIFVAESVRRPFITFIAPLRHADPQGVLIASVSLEALSRYLLSLQDHILGTPFILRGADSVLAHPRLPQVFARLTDRAPLPGLDELDDRPLAGFWSEARVRDLEARFANSVQARVVTEGGDARVFLYRELTGYDDVAWLVGLHVPLSSIAPRLGRLELVSLAVLAAVVTAFVASLLLSRALTGPIKRLAASAGRLGQLEFDPGATPRRSLFREVNAVFDALALAHANLTAFGRYVPKALVRKLLPRGDAERVPGTLTEVTVLFTDIVGFTAMSEEMSAAQIERLLNEHFSLLNGRVEAFGGTTDKYIGDSLMAFWGAPDDQADHALRACRAAAAIAAAIRADNDRREARGRRRIHLRIGIHSGPVIAGDIGSPERVNYTVVGDTVNIAERLEQAARGLDGDGADVVAVISRQTATQAGGHLAARSLGHSVLHGRRGRIEALVLDLDVLAAGIDMPVGKA